MRHVRTWLVLALMLAGCDGPKRLPAEQVSCVRGDAGEVLRIEAVFFSSAGSASDCIVTVAREFDGGQRDGELSFSALVTMSHGGSPILPVVVPVATVCSLAGIEPGTWLAPNARSITIEPDGGLTCQ